MNVKYVYFYLLQCTIHRSLAVLSIILIFCAHVVKEFIIQKMYRVTSYLFVILSIVFNSKIKKNVFVAFSHISFVFIVL